MEWATGLKNKYQQDLFFRTECNVIFFQIICSISLLILVGVAFNYLYQNITQTLIAGILESISHSKEVSGKDIVDSLSDIKTHNFIVVLVFTGIITTIFGYAVAHISFKPAKNALESQKRFVSDIAHELRTPLAIMKTNSEVALLNPSLSTAMRDILKSNVEELDRTSEIINNLLSLNKVLRNERMNFAMVDLGDLVENTARKLRKLAEGKKLSLTTQIVAHSTAWGNATAIEQVVSNLIRNAINYTPEDGHITASVGRDYQGNATLTVTDTGIGIAQKDLFHIFEPFYRADHSRNRASGSSGLGLTIVSEIIKLHAGKINVKSTVRKGTSITITLPSDKKGLVSDPDTYDVPNEITLGTLDKPSTN